MLKNKLKKKVELYSVPKFGDNGFNVVQYEEPGNATFQHYLIVLLSFMAFMAG